MTAAVNPKTPMMNLPLQKGTSLAEVERFCRRASRLSLSQLIEHISVSEQIREANGIRKKEFSVNIALYPQNELVDAYYVNLAQVATALEALSARLKRDISMELKKLDADMKAQAASVGKGRTERDVPDLSEEDVVPGQERDDISEIGDGDADEQKRASQAREQTTYDEEIDDDPDTEEEGEGIVSSVAAIENYVSEDESAGVDAMDVDYGSEDNWRSEMEEVEAAFGRNLPLVQNSFSFNEKAGLRFGLEVRPTASQPFLNN